MLFERFKMALYENCDEGAVDDEKEPSKIKIKDTLTATNGKTVSADIVFVAAFKHLQGLAKKMLRKKKLRGIKDKNIQWIITVPAIWNDATKYKMRGWAIDA